MFFRMVVGLVCLLVLLPQMLSGQFPISGCGFIDKEDERSLDCVLDKAFQLFEKGYPDSALQITRQLQPLAQRGSAIEARRLYINSLIYHGLSQFDSSQYVGLRAAEQYQNLGQLQQASKALNAIGNALRDDGQLLPSTEYYFKSIDMASQAGADSLNAATFSNLSIVFLYLDDQEKYEGFIKKAYYNAKQYNNLSILGRAAMGLCQAYRDKAQIDSAEFYAKEALTYSLELNQPLLTAYAYVNLAYVEKDKGNWEIGDQYFRQIIEDERIPSLDRGRFLYFFGDYELERQRPREAASIFEQGMEEARSANAINLQHTIASRLYPLYDELQNYPKAYQMALEFIHLTDTIYQKESVEQIRELNAKYETVEKEKALQATEIEVIKRTNQRNLLLGLAGGLLLLGIIGYFGLRRRARLNQLLHEQENQIVQQQIQQMQQEQKLLAIQSMVAGEEAERSRLAQELHDGLGGMLSNLKLTLGKVAESNPNPDRDPIDMVDKASKELRRIAQNMMPESLVRFGLIQALEDLVSDIQTHADFAIDLQYFNVREPLPQQILLPMYRIVQELLHNVIKHAQATEVLVQLIQRESVLYLTVEDDGVGLHWDQSVEGTGRGLKNIKSRLTFLKGQVQAESQQGKGTTINIEIPIP